MVPVSSKATRAPLTVPFVHLTAFSTHIAGGNPAAVVLVSREQDALLSTSERQAIAANFHQPMTAFIVPREIDEKAVPTGTLAFDARFFTASIEPGLCGHATLATAAALFGRGALFCAGVVCCCVVGHDIVWKENDVLFVRVRANLRPIRVGGWGGAEKEIKGWIYDT